MDTQISTVSNNKQAALKQGGSWIKYLLISIFILITSATPILASGGGSGESPDMSGTFLGIFALILFVSAYCLVIFEEQLHLRKSKPVLLAAGVIWVLVALAYIGIGDTHTAHNAIKHNLIEYSELFLFLLVAMTYINAMDERNVFQALRAWLVSRGFTLRTVFWVTGVLAFFISPIADNLTTALLMGAVAMAVAGNNKKFLVVACINIVVAANAGGAFSPFGDITTLMVWQKGKVEFIEFFAIFVPSVVNWLIPAIIMSLTVAKERPEAVGEAVKMKLGARRVMVLFLCTIITAVSFHNFLHLPPATGMMRAGMPSPSKRSRHISAIIRLSAFLTSTHMLNHHFIRFILLTSIDSRLRYMDIINASPTAASAAATAMMKMAKINLYLTDYVYMICVMQDVLNEAREKEMLSKK